MKSTPEAKARATESRIAAMMTMAFPVLMNSERWWIESPASPEMRKSAAATAAPSSPKTIETVVEVGSPRVL